MHSSRGSLPTGTVAVSLGAEEASKMDTVASSPLVTTRRVGRLGACSTPTPAPAKERVAAATRVERNTMLRIGHWPREEGTCGRGWTSIIRSLDDDRVEGEAPGQGVEGGDFRLD